MATFSNLLRFITQDTGENTNVWGDSLNAGAIRLIEDAIAATLDVSVTVGDVTLTTANGAADQARNMILNATGNPGVAREIIVPALSKLYVGINNTSPLQDVLFKTAAGTGITIATAATPIWLYCDGTNVIAISVDSVALATNALQLGGFAAALYPRLALANLFTAGQSVQERVIASGATPTPNFALGNVFSFRPSVGFVFQKPTNPASGQTANIIIEIAGGTGGTFVAEYHFPGGVSPTIPGSAGEKWLISLQYDITDDIFIASALEDVS